MIPLDTLVTFTAAATLLALLPGPDNLFVLALSMSSGPRAGLLVTLGLCTGLVVHTLLTALGVAALIRTSETAFQLVQVAGVAYLLYLAWENLHAVTRDTLPAASRLRSLQLYRRGILMNLTNPKVLIFFLAFLPPFADPARGPVTLQILLLGGLFILCALVVFSLIGLLSGVLGQRLARSRSAQCWLHRLTAAILVLIAIQLGLSTIS